MSVINFPTKKEEKSFEANGKFSCLGCKHEWEGTHKVPLIDIDCPSCGTNKGMSKYAASVPIGGDLYLCNCGSDAFRLTLIQSEPHKLCINCGVISELINLYD